MRDATDPELFAEAPPSELLLFLLHEFRRHAVSFCYWRSGRRVAAALSGETDLDLLIARESQHSAARVLLACGFKPFPAVPARDHPSLQSYLGHDEAIGRLLHVHVHLRLVVGDALLRQVRLPWERAVLESAVPHPVWPLPVLDAETEAVLMLTRAAVEMHWADPVAQRHRTRKRARFLADRAALATRVDRDRLRLRAVELLGPAAGALAPDFLFDTGPWRADSPFLRSVRRSLAAFRTYNAPETAARRVWRTAAASAGALNRRVLHLPRPWSRRCPGGGVIIAVLGVDGSGKSTLVRALRTWLGAEIDVLPLYFGTGDGRPSLLLLPFKLMVPLATRLVRRKPRGASHGQVTDQRPGWLYTLGLAVWASLVAAEKRRKLLAARRGADRGLVVLTDRYPQDEIPGFNDGPLLPRLPLVPTWLRRREARAYALTRRVPPDLAIKLTASPDLIAQRELSMAPAVIADRVASLAALRLPGARVVSIAASQPLAEVIRAAKAEVWRML